MVLRKSLLLLFLFVIIFIGTGSAIVSAQEGSWETITTGIEFQEYQLPDPNNVFVVRMDRTNPNVTIESSIADGKLADGRETVSSMFTRYDQALNFWGGSTNPPNWGMRNQVVVAINGSYFDWNSGVPQGGQVQSGWYAKRYEDYGGWSGFAWMLDRSTLIGECVYHRSDKQFITYPGGITQQIAAINTKPGNDELTIFTPQYDSRTGTDDTEVLIEMTRPTMILPSPASAVGIVRQINLAGNSLIPFNYIVLSASGSAAQSLIENVQVGSQILVSQEISSCPTYEPISWTKAYASIQGAFYYLKNGQIREFNDDPGATNPNPRTAIAYNDQYIYFIVVDGRDIKYSIGMTIQQLALFTRDTLGATFGVAQDGGGSSTMVINGQVVNNTFCNNYYCMGQYRVYLPMITRNSQPGQPAPQPRNDIIWSTAGVERAVANGMMMVVAQPKASSPAFITADHVTTITDVMIRLGPGTNYAGISTISNGSSGTIVDQMNGLNGVLAKSSYWWYVNINGLTGWLPETALVKQSLGDTSTK